MKWKKLGKIFDPTQHCPINGCQEFAQSPQSLILDDIARIYFSTRKQDKSGKYLSHVSYVEFDTAFKSIRKISTDQVLSLGKLGCYDEHGIFPLNILKDDQRVLGYIGGWSRRVSVSVETSIGLAVSYDNGLTFNRIGDGPVLTSSLEEPMLVGDPFVAKFNNSFYMWYIFGLKWIHSSVESSPQRIYKIALATSDNGVSWHKKSGQLIPDRINENECQALPSVIKINDRYHMLFCYRHADDFRKNRDRAYRIGYAFSDDLVHWTRDDDRVGIDVSKNGWDSDMQCYPHLFQCNGNIYLLYNGNEFGRYGFGLAILENIN